MQLLKPRKVAVIGGALALLSFCLLATGPARADQVPHWLHSEQFPASNPAKKARTVPAEDMERYLRIEEAESGVEWSVQPCDGALCLDIVKLSDKARPVDIIRGIWIAGRMVQDDFSEMRLVDGEIIFFRLPWDRIREIGEAFVWGEEGRGQNPIHLQRMFVDAIRRADNSRAAPVMNGSLLGDTSISLEFINKDFVPRFALPALE